MLLEYVYRNTKQHQGERLGWILLIHNKEVKFKEVVKLCPCSKISLERWLSLYRKYGAKRFILKSTQPKINPQKTPVRVKKRVLELRRETKLYALKLHWKLEKEDIHLYVPYLRGQKQAGISPGSVLSRIAGAVGETRTLKLLNNTSS